MRIDEEKLENFWRWFVQNENLIRSSIEQESSIHREFIIEELNNQILDFGRLTWDLGLDEENNWFITISPNGDLDLLELTERIMEDAPYHLDWIFHSFRPAKNWNRFFRLYDNNMDTVEIDASSWHYVAFLEKDDKVELIIEAKNLNHLDTETKELAGNLFIEYELGEKMRMQHISTVTLVSQLSYEDENSKYPISDLKEHLDI